MVCVCYHGCCFLGNEVHIVVQADTEYDKKDSNNHYGLKCQVVGYEWTNNAADVSAWDVFECLLDRLIFVCVWIIN